MLNLADLPGFDPELGDVLDTALTPGPVDITASAPSVTSPTSAPSAAAASAAAAAAPVDTTLLVLAEHHVDGIGWFTRTLGLNGALSVAETVRAVLIAFSWPGASGMLDGGRDRTDVVGGWSLQARRDDRLRVYSPTAGPVGTRLDEALGRDGTGTIVADGYPISVTTAGTMPRDGHTPDAVCLAGSFAPDPGAAADHPAGVPGDVDLAAVNVALAGKETVDEVLAELDPELADLIRAGALYEFIPLLQALDLERPAQVPDRTRAVLAGLPAETTADGRAAAWARIIALSTLSERDAVDAIAATLLGSLGITGPDGAPLDEVQARALCRDSAHRLATCGADAWSSLPGETVATPLVPRCSLLDRLEMYRFLLQRREMASGGSA
ncbi:MAG TPA: hypothetical protein DIW82_05790 [Corynebacterium nuruki]|uniref:Uncharacterized protein n=1 Tax=Corynebacterium nuruki TaxID=1032851 RepID=A0A3D4SYF4_9CORY|nr:hypothetical protein [Corynebacterium nuruki]